jgi:hypothetical protein
MGIFFLTFVVPVLLVYGIPALIVLLKKKPEETFFAPDPTIRESQYQGCIFILAFTLIIVLFVIATAGR